MLENQKPGTPQSVWQVPPGADSQLIQGFTTSISTNVGGTVNFKINNQTGNAKYSINIYRLGCYGGDGATLVTTLQHQATSAVIQPAPLTDPSTGMVDAGNWSVTDSWTVPTTRFASTGEMSGSGALVPHSEAASLTRTDTAREWSRIARYL